MNKGLLLGIGITGLAFVALGGASCSSSGSSSDGGGTGGKGGGAGGGKGGTAGGGSGGVPDAGSGAGGSAGGSAGAGGTTVVDAGNPLCLVPQYTHTSLFGSSFDGWGVPPNNPTFSLAPMMGVDGGPPTGTIQSLDTAVGNPAPGSAKLQIPFSDVGQQLLFAQNFTSLNLSGTTVTAQIKLDSGLIVDPVASVARAFLVLKTTAGYNYATGVAVNLDVSAEWITLSVNANAPSTLPFGYDPCDVREIDVEIDTGQTGTYTAAVVHIDTIAITSPNPTDASTSDSDAASTDAASTDAATGS